MNQDGFGQVGGLFLFLGENLPQSESNGGERNSHRKMWRIPVVREGAGRISRLRTGTRNCFNEGLIRRLEEQVYEDWW